MSERAVLFDIDGTLVDSTYHHALAWHRAFAGRGLTVPMWRVHRTIGMGGDKLVAHVTDDATEAEHGDELREAWEREYAAIVDEVPPLAGAEELVRKLSSDGFVVALASSGKKHFSEDAARLLGIEEAVHTLTTSDDADGSKPEPDIVSVTLEKVGAARAVFVGDTPYDVEAAGRAGISCIAVLSGGFSRAELEDAGAALVVEDLTALMDIDWADFLSGPHQKETP